MKTFLPGSSVTASSCEHFLAGRRVLRMTLSLPLIVPAFSLAGLGGVVQHDAQVERLAAVDVAGDGDLFDGHFAARLIADRHHVDADARLGQPLRLSRASPRFSLPSLTITMRLAASSGNEAWASFMAPARLV